MDSKLSTVIRALLISTSAGYQEELPEIIEAMFPDPGTLLLTLQVIES